jgi:hypothetical protein
MTFFPYTTIMVMIIALPCHSALQEAEMEVENTGAEDMLQITN